jgi:phosphatidylglycerophosphatase A
MIFAEAFLKYFQSVYSSSCPGTFPFIDQFKEVLFLAAPVSNSDVHNVIK